MADTRSKLKLQQLRKTVTEDADFVKGSDTMLKLDHTGNKVVLGDGSTITVEIAGEIVAGGGIKDEDNMASNSAVHLATQQSIKAYVDAGGAATLDTAGDSGTGSVALANQSLAINGGNGITTTAANQAAQISLDENLTTVSSILKSNLVIGRDADNDIDFGTDNKIIFRADGADQLSIDNGAIVPVTNNDIDLGTSSNQFKDGFFDGTLEADAITVGGVALDEVVTDLVGGMVTGNTETGIAVTFEDSDNTLDFAVTGNLLDVNGLNNGDGNFIVGDGSNFIVESGATARTSMGVGTGDSPQFTGVNVGHASDTTISRAGAGDIQIENNIVYRAGGTDVPVTDGGTGRSTLASGEVLLGNGNNGINSRAIGIADTNITRIDDADAAANDYVRLTANGLEGRDYSEVLSDLSGQAGADFSINSRKITNLAAPTADTDAATKLYVDSVAEGLDVKESVYCATTANMPDMSYSHNGGTDSVGTLTAGGSLANSTIVLDGIPVTKIGQRVLFKDLVDPDTRNGIYTLTTVGVKGRASSMTIRVMGNFSNINANSTFVFDTDQDGAGGDETYTITFTKPGNGNGNDSESFSAGRAASIRLDQAGSNATSIAEKIRLLFLTSNQFANERWEVSEVTDDSGGKAFTVSALITGDSNYDFANVTANVNSQGEIFGSSVASDTTTGAASAVFTRAGDCNNLASDGSSAEFGPGHFTFTEKGDTQADSGFVCITDDDIPFQNQSIKIAYSQFSGAGSFSASNGVIKVGSDFQANLASLTAAVVDPANDEIAIIDANDSNTTKRESVAHLVSAIAGDGLAEAGGIMQFDPNSLTAANVAVGNDSIVIIDADASNAPRKESVADLVSGVASTGLVANSGQLEVALNRENGLSGGTIAPANDSIIFIDADDSNNSKKETVADFVGLITGNTMSVTSGVADVAVTRENGLSAATVAVASDSIVIIDADDSNESKKESIVDFVGAIAGAGSVGASGVINIVNKTGGGLNVEANQISVNPADFSNATVNLQTDGIVIYDASTADSCAKRVGFSDYGTAIAGSGLSSTNGVLSAALGDGLTLDGNNIKLSDSGTTLKNVKNVAAFMDVTSAPSDQVFIAGAGEFVFRSVSEGNPSGVSNFDGLRASVSDGEVQNLNRSGAIQVFLNGSALCGDITGDHSSTFTYGDADWKFVHNSSAAVGSKIELHFRAGTVENGDFVIVQGICM